MKDRSNPRILVVDDWHDTADSMASLLSMWGYVTRACYDGLTALAIALDYQPHVILLDVAMPRMDGFKVAGRLRNMPELEGVAVIGITGYGSLAWQASALNAGFDYCLMKPVEIDYIKGLIESIVIPMTMDDSLLQCLVRR
jgi:CheY-like chemotaxis protein